MLTICPTCRHRFLQPRHFQESSEQDRWKEAKKEDEKEKIANTVHSTTSTCYVGGLLVPREYTNGDSCFVNAPTIIHGSTVEPFQSAVAHCDSNIGIAGSETVDLSCDPQSSRKQDDYSLSRSWKDQLNNQASLIMAVENVAYETSSEQHIVTTCKLAGGSVTITAPNIQWSNSLIQSTEDGIRVQPPHVEIQPKLTGGGCLIQKSVSTETEQLSTSKDTENSALIDNNAHQMLIVSPSGCSELPGNKWIYSPRTKTEENSETTSPELKQQQMPNTIRTNKCCDCMVQQKFCQCYQRSSDASLVDNHDSLLLKPVGSGVQIRLNATVQLPANLGQCTVNITATTAPCSPVTKPTTKPRTRNNFNGGGIVQPEEADCATRNRIIAIKDSNSNEWKNEPPMSWLMPCPWSLGTDLLNKDVNRLREVRKLLQICGWYHEGVTWQQSEDLLKNAPVGRWLMRDSSDSKYIFAVSIQTARGPTSVRVHYFFGQFRLDAEPRLTLAMPLFSCPISMLEHYVEYSKIEHRREVWVDYNGQLYSHIYLTKPLVKEVRTLSHLARLAVNRNKLPTKHLPLLIRDYLAEYPYTL
ncbi:uncharacterized protein [Linepithema humile]|uniref:uncharacterized protein n=1 Tax=Linepithema humile TaxID=83485 RepID=UPI0006234D89|nr:PREDICTED: uncharacterized protein LOC105669217 [Linepithema humile]XP_012217474.1 PREDICTED: uncharacterized protein LOC105669217 [Linepithema humile]